MADVSDSIHCADYLGDVDVPEPVFDPDNPPPTDDGTAEDQPPATPLPTGDRRETLIALRDDLARRIPAADDRVVAPLVRQLTQVLTELDELAPASAPTSLGAMLQAVPD